MSKFLKFIIMGAPGSGKGTIAKRIINEMSLKFLSSGDLLRNEISSTSGDVIASISLPIHFFK